MDDEEFATALVQDRECNRQYGYTSSLIGILLKRFCPHSKVIEGRCKKCGEFIHE